MREIVDGKLAPRPTCSPEQLSDSAPALMPMTRRRVSSIPAGANVCVGVAIGLALTLCPAPPAWAKSNCAKSNYVTQQPNLSGVLYLRGNDSKCLTKSTERGWTDGDPIVLSDCNKSGLGWELVEYKVGSPEVTSEGETCDPIIGVGLLRSTSNPSKCVHVVKDDTGPKVVLGSCDYSSRWYRDGDTGRLHHASYGSSCLTRSRSDWRDGNPLVLRSCEEKPAPDQVWATRSSFVQVPHGPYEANSIVMRTEDNYPLNLLVHGHIEGARWRIGVDRDNSNDGPGGCIDDLQDFTFAGALYAHETNFTHYRSDAGEMGLNTPFGLIGGDGCSTRMVTINLYLECPSGSGYGAGKLLAQILHEWAGRDVPTRQTMKFVLARDEAPYVNASLACIDHNRMSSSIQNPTRTDCLLRFGPKFREVPVCR